MVFDMDTPAQVGELEDVSARRAFLSADGQSLVSLHSGETYSLRCWSLPLGPPLTQVIGIPIGVALLFLAGGWVLRPGRAAKEGQTGNHLASPPVS